MEEGRSGEVASVLCMDVKGAFPSVDLEHLMHDMRMRGVPQQHTEWMVWRYEGWESCIVFDDYTSEPFTVEGGLDQGDLGSGIAYLIYNSDLAKVPSRARRSGEDGVVYVDNNTMIATGPDFNTRHGKLADMTGRAGGVDKWEASHNAKFGLDKYQLLDARWQQVQDIFRPRKLVPV
jgi:hypothetical protein